MQLGAIVNVNDEISYQLPYIPGVTVKFNQKTMFGPTQQSTLLNTLGVNYITVSAKAQTHGMEYDEANDMKLSVIDWFTRKPSVKTGKREWGFAYGTSNEEAGHRGIYTEIKDGKVLDLAALGFQILDKEKAPKDMRRILNYYPYAFTASKIVTRVRIEGKLRRKKIPGEAYVVELENGKRFAVINWLIKEWNDEDVADADGKDRVHPDALKHCKAPRYGIADRFYCTIFGPDGVGKGVAEPDPNLGSFNDIPVWFVTYGAKKRVLYNKFFFGVLNYIHAEDVRSDLQALTNLAGDTHVVQRAEDLAIELVDAFMDIEKLKRVLLKAAMNLEKPDEETWSLIQLLKADIDPRILPGGMGKIISHLMNKMFDAERGRLDISHIAVRVLFDTDPFIWDEWGLPNKPSVIPEGAAVCMDVPMPEGVDHIDGVIHRQPIGHAMERADLTIYRLPAFKKYEGKHIIFYGRKNKKALKRQNGADKDDHGNLYFDLTIVKMMRALTYPVVPKLDDLSDKVAKATDFGARLSKKLRDTVIGGYGFQDFVQGMRDSLSWSMKIGQIVNLIMLDTLLSGRHKKHMLAWLEARIANPQEGDNVKLLKAAYKWLKRRKDFQLRKQASNLEALIDFTQQAKDLGQREAIEALINEMSTMVMERDEQGNVIVHTMVFPRIWKMENRVRIPKALKENVDFVLAPSCLCEALEQVQERRKTFQAKCGEFEYALRYPLPVALDAAYPDDENLEEVARDERKWFNERMAKLVELKLSREEFQEEYKILLADWDEKLGNYMEQAQEAIVCQFVRIINDPRWDPSPNGLPAAAFMNNVSIAIFIRACRRVGIAGECYAMEFAPFTGDLYGKIVEVDVRGGQVYRSRDNFWIGKTDKKCPNGTFTLSPWGYIRVKEADPSLQFIDNATLAKAAVDVFAEAKMSAKAKAKEHAHNDQIVKRAVELVKKDQPVEVEDPGFEAGMEAAVEEPSAEDLAAVAVLFDEQEVK